MRSRSSASSEFSTSFPLLTVPHATTAADEAHILHLLQIGGGFGFTGLVCGWWLNIGLRFGLLCVQWC